MGEGGGGGGAGDLWRRGGGGRGISVGARWQVKRFWIVCRKKLQAKRSRGLGSLTWFTCCFRLKHFPAVQCPEFSLPAEKVTITKAEKQNKNSKTSVNCARLLVCVPVDVGLTG